MFNEDGRVAVVFNGEIYNFPDLVRTLEAHGHQFRTRCDTEVIVHAWEQWGPASVERFRGMFAFAVWDAREQTLFIARDRLGIKPLYYALLADGSFIFSSELKGLLAHPGLSRELDPAAVEDYLAYGYVPDPKTIFKNVCKLEPAHRLVVSRGRSIRRPAPYWEIDFRNKHDRDDKQTHDELLDRLRDAVQVRLIADVPLGAFLSGGIDSSAIVSLMAGLSEDPVQTCTISFDAPEFDESGVALTIAERFGTRHHVRRVDASSFGLVDRLAGIYDEPFADSSALPTFHVCALARERVTVALSGDGGDELFAGYRRYRWHGYEEKVRQNLSAGLRTLLFASLGAVYPKMDWGPRRMRAKSTFLALAKDTAGGYFDSVSIIPDRLRKHLYSGDMMRELNGYDASEVLRQHIQRAPADTALDRVQYADIKTYLAGDILTKVDRASMANSLEVRVPILDHLFVEWAAGLTPAQKLRNGVHKHVFKKALEQLLPPEVLYRPKMGFSVPLAAWFRGPLRAPMEAALNGGRLGETGLFNEQRLRTLLRQHTSGVNDQGPTLWSLIMLEAFLENSFHGNRPSLPDSPSTKVSSLA